MHKSGRPLVLPNAVLQTVHSDRVKFSGSAEVPAPGEITQAAIISMIDGSRSRAVEEYSAINCFLFFEDSAHLIRQFVLALIVHVCYLTLIEVIVNWIGGHPAKFALSRFS